jgi:hypothetical protein
VILASQSAPPPGLVRQFPLEFVDAPVVALGVGTTVFVDFHQPIGELVGDASHSVEFGSESGQLAVERSGAAIELEDQRSRSVQAPPVISHHRRLDSDWRETDGGGGGSCAESVFVGVLVDTGNQDIHPGPFVVDGRPALLETRRTQLDQQVNRLGEDTRCRRQWFIPWTSGICVSRRCQLLQARDVRFEMQRNPRSIGLQERTQPFNDAMTSGFPLGIV